MKVVILLVIAGLGALSCYRPAAGLTLPGVIDETIRRQREDAAAALHAKEYSREAALLLERVRLDGRRLIMPGIVIPPTVSSTVTNAQSPLEVCSTGAPWVQLSEVRDLRRTGQHYTGIAWLIVGRGDCPMKVKATLEFQMSNPPEGSGVRRVLFVVSYVMHKRAVE
jgi:hypothetical protein